MNGVPLNLRLRVRKYLRENDGRHAGPRLVRELVEYAESAASVERRRIAQELRNNGHDYLADLVVRGAL